MHIICNYTQETNLELSEFSPKIKELPSKKDDQVTLGTKLKPKANSAQIPDIDQQFMHFHLSEKISLFIRLQTSLHQYESKSITFTGHDQQL